MDRCAYQQQIDNNNAWLRGGAGGERMNSVVCPRPRRFGLLNPCVNDSIIIPRSDPRWQQHYPIHQTEIRDSESETELLDMIWTKECYCAEGANNPFFCGSPPSRAANPVIQDAQFGNKKPSPLSPAFEVSPSSLACKNSGSYARVKFGQKPAAVRVEGFNCRGISAVA